MVPTALRGRRGFKGQKVRSDPLGHRVRKVFRGFKVHKVQPGQPVLAVM
jgi:hypothetical protein